MLRGFWQKVGKALRSFLLRGLAGEGVGHAGWKCQGWCPERGENRRGVGWILREWAVSGRPRVSLVLRKTVSFDFSILTRVPSPIRSISVLVQKVVDLLDRYVNIESS